MRKAILLLALLLLAGVPLDPMTAAAQSEPARAVWWGPTGMSEGWHVRIPFAVHNPTSIPREDATVGEDVDLRRALLDAKWPSGRVGLGRVLQVFDLDPESVRVVEYRALGTGTSQDGLVVGEVPSRARLGFLERSGSYHGRSSPDLHVEWVLPGKLDAGATRYFMIYVDTLANGEKPPAAYAESAVAPLDGRYWISRGTRLVGQAATLAVVGLEDDTEVIVSVYDGGRPQPLPDGKLRVGRGEFATLELNTDPLLVRVDANRPVLAIDLASPSSGPIPSVDGGLLGRTFDFVVNTSSYLVVAPDGSATVTRTAIGSLPSQVILTPSRPATAIDRATVTPAREQLSSDEPILVLAHPTLPGIVQYPTPEGASVGSRVIAWPLAGYVCTDALACPPRDCVSAGTTLLPGEAKVVSYPSDAYARARDLSTSAQVLPMDAASRPDPNAALVPAEKSWDPQVTTSTSCPLQFHGTAGRAEQAFDPSARLSVFGGSLPARGVLPPHTTAIGGPLAQSLRAFSETRLVALYNATQVAVEQGGRAQPPVGLGAGDVMPVQGARGSPAIVNATKPVLLLPVVGGGFFAGLDASLHVRSLGPAEHRGYLVSLEPADGAAEPLSGLTSPGRPLTFHLLVRNLARDASGRSVADSVDLAAPPAPEGWTVELSATRLRLEPGGERTVELKVTPSTEAAENSRLTLAVTATSLANPSIVDRLQTVTLVRAKYEVDVWFDREGGPKIKTITTDPGAPRDVTIVVKNLAPISDRILVRIGGVSPDWGVEFAEGGALLDLPLEPGEAREVTLGVRPPAGNGSQSLLLVSAESSFDSAAAAQVQATLRVRADLRIALDVLNETLEVLPGGTAAFDAVFRNRGTDAVGIRIGTSGARPPGWDAPAIRVRGYEIDEISDIPAGGELPFQLLVPIPANASRGDRSAIRLDVETIPQFVGDPVLRESVDVLAVAAFRHDLRDDSSGTLFQVDPKGEVLATRALVNHGNGAERLRVLPRALPPGASFATSGLADVPVGERGSVETRLRLPADTLAGTYEIEVAIVSDDGFTLPWRYNVSVPELSRAVLRPTRSVEAVAGASSNLSVEILNQGNVPLPMPPRLDAPSGWRLSWSGAATPLGPGEARLLALTVAPPAAQEDGDVALRPQAGWATADPLVLQVRHVRLEPRVEPRADGTALVAIHNAGTASAADVEVALLGDGGVVDRVHLQRIPAGGNASAVLAAPSEGAYVVRVGGGGDGLEAEEMPVAMRAASRETPAAAFAWLLLTVAAVALWRRGR